MWFRRPRVEDMPPEGDHLSPEEIEALALDKDIERLTAERLAQEAFDGGSQPPDHPDISADALLAWHGQITRAGRVEREYGLSALEFDPGPKEGTRAWDEAHGIEPEPEPEPEVVAGTPPTLRDMVAGTKDVWLQWLRDKKRS